MTVNLAKPKTLEEEILGHAPDALARIPEVRLIGEYRSTEPRGKFNAVVELNAIPHADRYGNAKTAPLLRMS